MMTPKKPDQLDAYVRVSRVGARDVESESYATEDIQRRQIERWAQERGVTIAAWHLDRDVSGSRDQRPALAAALERVKRGDTGGIIVATLDRFSRQSTIDALSRVAEVHEAGGVVASVGGEVPVDPTTDTGEFILTLFLALARMEWRRYASRWQVAKRRAVERGAHIGPVPLGYRRTDDGRLAPDPTTAPVVAEAFRIGAAQGPRHAQAYLQGAGLTRAAKHPQTGERDVARIWTSEAVRRLFGNRAYLGEVHYGEVDPTTGGRRRQSRAKAQDPTVVNRTAHEPLVELSVWTAANRKARDAKGEYKPADDYPLTHVVRCAGCGAGLVGARIGNDGRRGYRCPTNFTADVKRGERERCPAPPTVSADRLEEYVQAVLLHHVATQRPGETVPLVISKEELGEFNGDRADVQSAEAALRSAELRRNQDVADVRLREVLGDEAFYARLEAHAHAIAGARADFEAAVAAAPPELEWPIEDQVATASVEELPTILEQVGVRVAVANGRRPLTERVRLEAR
jgi:DNA invertase Pin-like site-specific DNA recombinase